MRLIFLIILLTKVLLLRLARRKFQPLLKPYKQKRYKSKRQMYMPLHILLLDIYSYPIPPCCVALLDQYHY